MNTISVPGWHTYIRIFYALLLRDIKVLRKQQLKSKLIDSGIILLLNIITFGGLFPMFGMSTTFIAPVYLGSVVGIIFFLGFTHAMRLVFDLRFNRYIDYQLTFPLPKAWLFAAIIAYTVIELGIITLPLLSIGIFALGTYFVPFNPLLILYSVIYLLSLTFFGIFFICLGLRYDFNWFMENMWPRRLTFLFCISTNFLVWNKVFVFSPIIGYLLLLNPTTYVAEGLRATLLNSPEYISPYLCILALTLYSAVTLLVLRVSVIKRLNPV